MVFVYVVAVHPSSAVLNHGARIQEAWETPTKWRSPSCRRPAARHAELVLQWWEDALLPRRTELG